MHRRDNTCFVAVKGASALLIGFSEFSSDENIAQNTFERFTRDKAHSVSTAMSAN